MDMGPGVLLLTREKSAFPIYLIHSVYKHKICNTNSYCTAAKLTKTLNIESHGTIDQGRAQGAAMQAVAAPFLKCLPIIFVYSNKIFL